MNLWTAAALQWLERAWSDAADGLDALSAVSAARECLLIEAGEAEADGQLLESLIWEHMEHAL